MPPAPSLSPSVGTILLKVILIIKTYIITIIIIIIIISIIILIVIRLIMMIITLLTTIIIIIIIVVVCRSAHRAIVSNSLSHPAATRRGVKYDPSIRAAVLGPTRVPMAKMTITRMSSKSFEEHEKTTENNAWLAACCLAAWPPGRLAA